VRWNELFGTELALVHGCFAQIVFSLLAALAVVSSPRWVHGAPRSADSQTSQLQRWSIVTAGTLYGQIVLGAVLRHTYSLVGQRGHLLVAFIAVAAVVWLLKLALEDRERAVLVPVAGLALLVAAQVLLGVEAWLLRFAQGIYPGAETQITIPQAAIRTAHVLTGFCIMAVAAVTALRTRRVLSAAPSATTVSSRLEGSV